MRTRLISDARRHETSRDPWQKWSTHLNLLILLVRFRTISFVYCSATWLTSLSSWLSTRICCLAWNKYGWIMQWVNYCTSAEVVRWEQPETLILWHLIEISEFTSSEPSQQASISRPKHRSSVVQSLFSVHVLFKIVTWVEYQWYYCGVIAIIINIFLVALGTSFRIALEINGNKPTIGASRLVKKIIIIIIIMFFYSHITNV